MARQVSHTEAYKLLTAAVLAKAIDDARTVKDSSAAAWLLQDDGGFAWMTLLLSGNEPALWRWRLRAFELVRPYKPKRINRPLGSIFGGYRRIKRQKKFAAGKRKGVKAYG